jgi:hypothetical protein
MPATGEGWRHWKGGLYTIVGMANHHDNGKPLVVYTPSLWGLAQLPPLHVRPLADFIAEVIAVDSMGSRRRWINRFSFEREVGCDPRCQFIAHRAAA